MKEKNEQFIETLKVCKNLNLREQDLGRLIKSDLDIKELYIKISKYINRRDTNDGNESDKILYILHDFLEAYNIMEDKEEFVKKYKKIIDLQGKYREKRDLDLFTSDTFNMPKVCLKLCRDLWVFKVIPVDRERVVVNFGNRLEYIMTSVYPDCRIALDIGKKKDIGGIFIKDDIVEYVKVDDLYDIANVILRVLDKDYDIVILPDYTSFRVDESYVNYIDMTKINNQKFLDLVLLRYPRKAVSIDYRDFWEIYDSEVNVVKLMNFLDSRLYYPGTWIEFISDTLRKMENIEVKQEILEEIERDLRIKSKLLSEPEFSNYMLHVNEVTKRGSIKYTLKFLGKEL